MNCVDDYTHSTHHSSHVHSLLYFFGHPSVVSFFCHQTHIDFLVAFPFYAAINSVLGAFTTSFTTYILPMVAFNITFRTQTDISDMAKPLPSWITTESRYKILWYGNWIVAGTLFVTGVGFGGYASMSNFISQINNFEYFAACYDCYLLED